MKNKKGFTLIEVLATVLILTIGITGMLMNYIYIMNIIINNTHRFNASLVLNQAFEEIQRRSFPPDVTLYVNESPYTVTLPATAGDETEYTVFLRDLGDIVTYDAGTLKHIGGTVMLDGRQLLEGEMMSSIEE